MKRYVLPSIVFGLLLSVYPLHGEESEPIMAGLFIDAGAADALWSEHLYLHGGVEMRLHDMFSLEIPVTYIEDQGSFGVLDTGLVIKYYPCGGDVWMGISLFQGVSIHGDERPVDWYHHMNEISGGYTLHLPKGCYVEPVLIFRDVGGIFQDSLELVSEYVDGYSRLRFCLNLGWIGVPIG